MTKPIFKFCENGDGRIAIGTGNRPIRFCRPCHLVAYGDQFTAWNVIIPHRELGLDPEDMAIACAKTGEDISSGTVWLDPVETRIDALVYGGLIEAVPVKAAPVKAGKTEV